MGMNASRKSPEGTAAAPAWEAPATAVVTCAVLELEFQEFSRGLSHVKHIEVLRQGLHNEPDKLRSELQGAIDRVERMDVEVIVLGYGLCSRGTEGVRTKRCLLVVPRAHDCITLLLGDKQRYANYVAEHPGTYWYSPGWNKHGGPPGKERYEKCYREYCEKYGPENAEFLMQTQQQWYTAYSRATYVDLGVGVTPEDVEFTRQCAAFLKWSFDHQHGDPKLLRDLLTGPWDETRFLVLRPGESLRMTADERVIETSPPGGGSEPPRPPRRDWR